MAWPGGRTDPPGFGAGALSVAARRPDLAGFYRPGACPCPPTVSDG